MRLLRLLAAVMLAVSTLVAAPSAGQQASGLRIVEAVPDPAPDEREFIELRNTGDSPLELAGWKLRDAPTAAGNVNAFTFPPWTLAPGARIVVWGGAPGDATGPSWSNSAAWNNAGDVVSLIEPAGTVVDVLAYGSSTYRPVGWEAALAQAAPGDGEALAWTGAEWTTAIPSPGTSGAGTEGVLSFEVANLAPTANLVAPSDGVVLGQALNVHLVASDGNGDADVATWTLSASNGVVLAAGTTGGIADVALVASERGWLNLTLVVEDQAGLSATASASIPVRGPALRVQMEGIPGPVLLSADATVAQTGIVAHVTNEAGIVQRVRIDVSPLSGAGSRPAEGMLEVGWTVAQNTTWMPYTAAWMDLGELVAGETAALSFRITASGLPAGAYAASFSVVGQ